MGRNAIELFPNIGFGRHHDGFLMQPVGVEAVGRIQQRRDLFGKTGLDRIGLAARRGLGLLGEYIGRIYMQVRERPRYLIDAVLEQRVVEKSSFNIRA